MMTAKRTASELRTAFPAALRQADQWVCWRLEPRDPEKPDGDMAKVPYQPTTAGKLRARVDERRTWGSFEQAVRTYELEADVAGIGFVFTQNDPFTFIDLDHVLGQDSTPAMKEYVAWLLDDVFDSWAELSQSGTGVHVLILGNAKRDKKISKSKRGDTVAAVQHEIYPYNRFAALTGNVAHWAELAPREDEVNRLIDVLDAYQGALVALNREENAELAAVWKDEVVESDRSRDDMRLAHWVAKLAHGDEAKAEWLMRLSSRWRTKWNEVRRSSNEDEEGVIDRRSDVGAQLTYLEVTVGRACRSYRAKRAEVDAVVGELGTAASVLATAPLTDAGDVECFMEMYADKLRYNKVREAWYVWNGSAWRADDANAEVRRAILQLVRARKAVALTLDDDTAKALHGWALKGESRGHREAIEKDARQTSVICNEELDGNSNLLGVQNGVLELSTRTFREAKPSDMVSKQLSIAHDPAAACPRWRQFVSEIFGHDEELVRYVQRAAGYSLIPSTREQVAFLCVGTGSNGKSLLLNTLAKVFGDYAGRASFRMLDADKGGGTEEIARLKGARLLTIIESNEDWRLDEAKVKSITGSDALTASYKYGHVFDFVPQFTPWLAVNREPRIVGTDKGIWRRIRKIPFEQCFEGDYDDKELAEKLESELPGILNWLLEGLAEWQKQGLGRVHAVDVATEQYRDENDTVRMWANEMLNADDSKHVAANVLYQIFADWQRTRGERMMTMNSWGRRMHELGYKKQKGGLGGGREAKNIWYYVGIEVDDSALSAMQELT